MQTPDLSALNSATKYPSIQTYHELDPKNGRLIDGSCQQFAGPVILTEKNPGDDKCGVCGRNPVYIGSMCRPCYEEQAYPDPKPEAEGDNKMKYIVRRIARMQCVSCLKEGANPKTGLCKQCSPFG